MVSPNAGKLTPPSKRKTERGWKTMFVRAKLRPPPQPTFLCRKAIKLFGRFHPISSSPAPYVSVDACGSSDGAVGRATGAILTPRTTTPSSVTTSNRGLPPGRGRPLSRIANALTKATQRPRPGTLRPTLRHLQHSPPARTPPAARHGAALVDRESGAPLHNPFPTNLYATRIPTPPPPYNHQLASLNPINNHINLLPPSPPNPSNAGHQSLLRRCLPFRQLTNPPSAALFFQRYRRDTKPGGCCRGGRAHVRGTRYATSKICHGPAPETWRVEGG